MTTAQRIAYFLSVAADCELRGNRAMGWVYLYTAMRIEAGLE